MIKNLKEKERGDPIVEYVKLFLFLYVLRILFTITDLLAKSWGSSTRPSLKVFDNLESAKRSLKSSQHREREELAIKTYVEVAE